MYSHFLSKMMCTKVAFCRISKTSIKASISIEHVSQNTKIFSILEEDSIFSTNASLPYGPRVNAETII